MEREAPACHRMALELGHGGFGGNTIGHLGEVKALRAAGLTIRNEPALLHPTRRFTALTKGLVRGIERQMTDGNRHESSL